MTDKKHLTEDELITLLGDFQPMPSEHFYAKMADAPWITNLKVLKVSQYNNTYGRSTTLVAILAMILVGALLVYRSTINESAPVKSAPISATSIPTPTYDPTVFYADNLYPLSVDEASEIAGFEARIPQLLPDDLQREGAHADDGLIVLHFVSANTFPSADSFDLVQWDITKDVQSLWLEYGFDEDVVIESSHRLGPSEVPIEENRRYNDPELELSPGEATQIYLWSDRTKRALVWQVGDIRYVIPPYTHSLSRDQLISIGDCMLIPHDIYQPDFFLVGLRRYFERKYIACNFDTGIVTQTFIANGQFIQLRQLPIDRIFNAVVDAHTMENFAHEQLGDVTVVEGEWIAEIGDNYLLNNLEPTAIGIQWQSDEFQFELWSVGAGRGLPDIGRDQLLDIAASLE